MRPNQTPGINAGGKGIDGTGYVYLFPFALLCVWQSIWQLEISVAPPFDQAVTWSASISMNLYIRVRLASFPIAQRGQLDSSWAFATSV